MQQNNKVVTIAVKLALTVVIGFPGFIIVGYLNTRNSNAGAFLSLPLMGALMAIWFYKPKGSDLPKRGD